jgi:hypothetical protein
MHYVYKEGQEPKLVTSEEYQDHLENGWRDTPDFSQKQVLVESFNVDDLQQELATKEAEHKQLMEEDKLVKKGKK